jgi:hypothetical protein
MDFDARTSSAPSPRHPEETLATGKAIAPARAKPKGPRLPIKALDARGKRLCELMTFGLDEDDALAHGLPPHTPLALEQAALIAGLRIKNARFIFSQPAFLKEYSAELQRIRKAHHARAIGTIAQIMEDEGDGTAATKTVRLKAANSLLDNPEARAPGVSVNINNGVQLSPGVVIRLPAGVSATPLESDDATPPVTIEHDDHHHEPRAIPRTERGNHE